ncbi:MAG: N-formylglutamate amidohydrolase [Prevotellaceae bacterium]|nr:N-formylglutamate amidohydrolase [Prevotellaceae bacterium]
MKNKIILNVPHASINGLEQAKWLNKEGLVERVYTWTDWHTNIIFLPNDPFHEERDVSMHVFPKSRFVVDVERLVDDEMECEGQGIVYERFEELTRQVDDDEKRRLYREREVYLEGIAQEILRNDGQGYNNILIDCHSFPPFLSDVDICVGFNEDASKPPCGLLDEVVQLIERYKFKCGVNTPYANSLQPLSQERLQKLRHGYCSFMMEVNKRTYLYKNTVKLKPGWYRVGDCINYIYLLLKNYAFT